MELPFEKTVCRYWKQTMYTMLTCEETQELKLPESMPDVGRMISAWGQVIIRGKEWRSNGIAIHGGVMIWALYVPEGGGPLQRLESWIPFQIRGDVPDSREDGIMRIEPFLRGADARVVSSRKIMFRAGVGMLVQVVAPDDLELYRMGEIPGDIEQKVERYPFVLTRETGEKRFLLEETLNLPAGMPKADKLVYFQLNPEVLEQKVLGSKAAFRGMGNLHLLYMDSDGKLHGTDFQIPFAQYVDLDGEYPSDAQISELLCITSLELEPGDDGALHLRCGMVGQHLINTTETVELLEDCYSPCRDVELEKQLCSVPAWLDQRQIVVDLSATIPMTNGSCVDMIFCPDAPTAARRAGGADLEAGGHFQGIILSEDGDYLSVQKTEKQSARLDTECNTVCFSNQPGRVSVREESGSWRTDTKMVLDIRSVCTNPVEMVTGVRTSEIRPMDADRPSVIIRRCGEKESLWDLAKRCGSTVGAIRRLNHLEGEPDHERLLLIPVL